MRTAQDGGGGVGRAAAPCPHVLGPRSAQQDGTAPADPQSWWQA